MGLEVKRIKDSSVITRVMMRLNMRYLVKVI